MEINTSRFGCVEIEPGDILLFPDGLPGMDTSRHWVLLSDAQNESVGWLQSTTSPEVALAVVSPCRFVPDYQVKVFRSELTSLLLRDVQESQVLVVVSKSGSTLTVNLKAPLLFNLERRLGRQVVVNDDQPLQYAITPQNVQLRRPA
ncbi:MAG: flagellar assembly protein FliW [Pirellulaceae bacterium]|nr:flagellar assembly protein FliW [Pirellulaceae bacterium]